MKELQTRCNQIDAGGLQHKDKEIAAAKEALANADMEKLKHDGEAASLKNALTITQTDLYSARNALQVRCCDALREPLVPGSDQMQPSLSLFFFFSSKLAPL